MRTQVRTYIRRTVWRAYVSECARRLHTRVRSYARTYVGGLGRACMAPTYMRAPCGTYHRHVCETSARSCEHPQSCRALRSWLAASGKSATRAAVLFRARGGAAGRKAANLTRRWAFWQAGWRRREAAADATDGRPSWRLGSPSVSAETAPAPRILAAVVSRSPSCLFSSGCL